MPNRRDFLKQAGKGSLVAAATGAGLSSFGSNEASAAETTPKHLKLIIRGDDVGYSEVCNIGTFKAVDQGPVTSLDVMFDCPGTIDALERLRKRPWLSIGWHNHCWGKPILSSEKVPSLVGKDGHFKWSVRDGTALVGDGMKKREEAVKLEDQVNYDEVVAEFRAQMQLCVVIVGRPPDTGGGMGGHSLVAKAAAQVAEEFRLKSGWFAHAPTNFTMNGAVFNYPAVPAKPEYRHLNIEMASGMDSIGKYAFDPPGKFEEERYDPMAGLRSDGDKFLEKEILQMAFHPGFIDDYLATDGGIQFTMNRLRVLDAHFLCSQELHEWLKEHHVELINQRDALNGTHEYQNHLKEAGSDLCMI